MALGYPDGVARGGQFLAFTDRSAGDEDPEHLAVWDLANLRIAGRVTLPAGLRGYSIDGFGLSDDGTRLAGDFARDNSSDDGGVRCWDTTASRELLRIDGDRFLALSSDGQRLVTDSWFQPNADLPIVVTVWDVSTAGQVARFQVPDQVVITDPDCRFLVCDHWNPKPNWLTDWLEQYGLSIDKFTFEPGANIHDAATGRHLGRVTGRLIDAAWSADGLLLATLDDQARYVRVWDVPPRKPLTWFVAGSTLFAAALGWLARRRARLIRATARN
jgi:WD40 repeat protein